MLTKTWTPCGRGSCAAEEGHAGTCADASGLGEAWMPVLDYESLYEVSDEGRVASLDRTTRDGRRIRGRILSPAASKAGYLHVSFVVDGHRETRSVHRIVLESFIGPRPDGMEACHGKGGPSDNRLSNLRWGTHSENNLDRVADGTHHHARKIACKRGHPYVRGNVAEGRVEKHGKRQCLACQRAWTDAKRHGVPLTQELADLWFATLTGAVT